MINELLCINFILFPHKKICEHVTTLHLHILERNDSYGDMGKCCASFHSLFCDANEMKKKSFKIEFSCNCYGEMHSYIIVHFPRDIK